MSVANVARYRKGKKIRMCDRIIVFSRVLVTRILKMDSGLWSCGVAGLLLIHSVLPARLLLAGGSATQTDAVWVEPLHCSQAAALGLAHSSVFLAKLSIEKREALFVVCFPLFAAEREGRREAQQAARQVPASTVTTHNI